MKKNVWVILLCFFSVKNPSFAQDETNKLEAIGEELLDSTNTKHTEYRRCLTTIGYNCAHWNDEYEQIEVHGPSIADTLTWIGDQLTKRKLVHFYQFEGCKIAVDMTAGSPAALSWREKKGDKLTVLHKSIFTPERQKGFDAIWFKGNGHYIYLNKEHRANGSASSPRRIVYSNDAALLDLTKIAGTKSYVVTDEEGNFVLRDAPFSSYRFNFFKPSVDHIIGTQFDDEAPVFTKGPSPFSDAEKDLNVFKNQYIPFDTYEPRPMFFLVLTPDDVEFALNIAKAFRHAIELCELKKP